MTPRQPRVYAVYIGNWRAVHETFILTATATEYDTASRRIMAIRPIRFAFPYLESSGQLMNALYTRLT